MERENPKVTIPDPYLDALDLFKGEIGEVKGILRLAIKSFNWIVAFVIGVMLIGFLTLLFTVVTFSMGFWQSYKQSNQSDVQVRMVTDLEKKIDSLQSQVNLLNNKIR